VSVLQGAGFPEVRITRVLAPPLATALVLALLLGLVTDAVRVDGTLSTVVALLGCAITGAAV
jgi:hypothetical protein